MNGIKLPFTALLLGSIRKYGQSWGRRMRHSHIDSDWTPEELLSQKMVFRLADVAKVLRTPQVDIIQAISGAQQEKEASDLGLIMPCPTVRLLDMAKFSSFFLEHFLIIRKIDPIWDGNTLLDQDGFFFLSEVCELIPFKERTLRRMIASYTNPREAFGCWKERGRYIVDMKQFSSFIKTAWQTPSEVRLRAQTVELSGGRP